MGRALQSNACGGIALLCWYSCAISGDPTVAFIWFR